ncbi:hypothetical protein [Deinococcus cellulosilyticus]|uniref:Uncharacterized protein n=1 Tax=Deinococcus cellulosilyticus (strain DSM 18568 / NBRC 106333 / KACC 11606 / 5516J-15) TaxID=1223518 RepID=A0A511NBA9_DEIC1|nr:hypothetical protein [Deinococcus cellulosilyticus]GEM50105.1 hypothetical protein DC3_57400 [Deinococcus cellulosilyticus NBRC 106333 = KACC 11606]
MGRGPSIDPERRLLLEQQAGQFTVEPTLPAEHLPQDPQQLQLSLLLDQQPRMDQVEAPMEEQLGKLLHQERVALRTLLMGRLRVWIEQTLGSGGLT